ncbi:hypothetical protein N7G274_009317 [Stereocaulon virgatum]|uniref:Uncharacterized protein n=1 Tax=Stereocaulon virgatum TaxID=373712 RepID=A0ABR3ZWX9_9LECA
MINDPSSQKRLPVNKFTGKDTSGPRWIKGFEHELEDFKQEGIVPAELYLKYLDLLLTEGAAGWLETNADALNLIYTPHPTQDTVEQVTSLLKERFPSKVVEAAPISFDAELSELGEFSVSDGAISTLLVYGGLGRRRIEAALASSIFNRGYSKFSNTISSNEALVRDKFTFLSQRGS